MRSCLPNKRLKGDTNRRIRGGDIPRRLGIGRSLGHAISEVAGGFCRGRGDWLDVGAPNHVLPHRHHLAQILSCQVCATHSARQESTRVFPVSTSRREALGGTVPERRSAKRNCQHGRWRFARQQVWHRGGYCSQPIQHGGRVQREVFAFRPQKAEMQSSESESS